MLIWYCGVEGAVGAIEKGPGTGGAVQQEDEDGSAQRGWRGNVLQGGYS